MKIGGGSIEGVIIGEITAMPLIKKVAAILPKSVAIVGIKIVEIAPTDKLILYFLILYWTLPLGRWEERLY